MKAKVLLFVLSVSTLAASRKIAKRGVLSEVNDDVGRNIDLPAEHHNGKIIPLEDEAPVGDLGAPPTVQDCDKIGHFSSVSSGAGLDISEVNLRNHIDLGKIVQEHVHIVQKLGIPIPQQFPVAVERRIPVKVAHPVDVPIERPYPVPVPVEVPVKVFRDVPVIKERRIPVPVKVHVKVPVEVPYKVIHPKPIPFPVYAKVPIPIPKVWIVKKKVPVSIHTYLEPLVDDGHRFNHHRYHEKW